MRRHVWPGRSAGAARAIFLGAAATLAALCALGGPASGEDKPKTRTLAPPERAQLVTVLKAYLDPDADFLKTRPALLGTLANLKGYELLADDQLPAIIYQARAFPQPPFAKRHLPKNADYREDKTMVSLTADVEEAKLRLTLLLPKSYVTPSDPKKPFDRPPTPLLITLHEEQDSQGPKGVVLKFPGEEVLKRRFDPAGPAKAVLEEWAVLAPVVPKGKWILDPSAISFQPILEPLRAVCERYHVDFDRFVLDGGSEALTFAAARPHFFAAVIVRGDAADLAPDLVKNLAGMPVYVAGTAASAAAKTLAANGHPADRVKVGGLDGLAEWLKTVRRVTPKSFHWTMKDAGMKLAYWVQITNAESTSVPMMDVEVVDTPEDPNTIRVRSKGVHGVAMLLNDRIVDLDRDVRIVVNRKPLASVQITDGQEAKTVKLPAKFARSVATAFATQPLNVRKNLAYGMIYSVILDGIEIKGDDPGDAPPEEPAAAGGAKPAEGSKPPPPAPGAGAAPAAPAAPEAPPSPEQIEADAKQKFEKAEGYEKDGDLATAKRIYKKIVDLGASTFKERAEAKLKELEAKVPAPK